MAANDLMQSMRAKLQAMEPKKRENLIKGALIGGGALFFVAMYYLSGQDAKKPPPPKEEPAVIKLGDARLQDDIRAQVEKERLEGQARNDTQDGELKSQKETIAQQQSQLEAMQTALHSLAANPGLGLPDVSPATAAPADPMAWGGTPGAAGDQATGPRMTSVRPLDPSQPPPAPPVVEFIGGVGSAKPQGGPSPTSGAGAGPEGSKKKQFYLPVSFMPAKLLTGLKAKTVESARGDPEPIVLRVQAPAILPNEVRAQLEGCLVVAHGYGSLASERVEARLVSINCLDFEGKSLIDAELKGIVVDKDGVKGLAGHPVSKMGANLARLALAGAISGAGEAFEDTATNTSISPLGQTQSIDPSQIGRAAIGKGVANASEEYAKIIAELVRQQSPVLEVGPAKDVTVVVTEGTYLEVKGYEEGP